MEGRFNTGRNASQKDELMCKHPNHQQNLRRVKLARFNFSPISCLSKLKTLWGKKNVNFHVRSVFAKQRVADVSTAIALPGFEFRAGCWVSTFVLQLNCRGCLRLRLPLIASAVVELHCSQQPAWVNTVHVMVSKHIVQTVWVVWNALLLLCCVIIHQPLYRLLAQRSGSGKKIYL